MKTYNTPHKEFFNWIYDRLVYKYHENPDYDYMHSFKERIEDLFSDKENPTDKAVKWFKEHWRDYIMGPDKDGCIGFGHWEDDFRKYMNQ